MAWAGQRLVYLQVPHLPSSLYRLRHTKTIVLRMTYGHFVLQHITRTVLYPVAFSLSSLETTRLVELLPPPTYDARWRSQEEERRCAL